MFFISKNKILLSNTIERKLKPKQFSYSYLPSFSEAVLNTNSNGF